MMRYVVIVDRLMLPMIITVLAIVPVAWYFIGLTLALDVASLVGVLMLGFIAFGLLFDNMIKTEMLAALGGAHTFDRVAKSVLTHTDTRARDLLENVPDGACIYNTDTEQIECYIDGEWLDFERAQEATK